MESITIKCPAKINLTLEVLNKREDGFHNIKSIMQMIDLYDTLRISVVESEEKANKIILEGNSEEIPYNEKNLVFMAADLFMRETGITNKEINIYIDKKIPVSAGLAGGSTDAAGTIFGLNEVFKKTLAKEKLHELCSKLGSDLNVCLEGGCVLATSRGEKILKLKSISYPVTIIKPKNLGISAKEAYTKYSQKEHKPKLGMTDKMLKALENEEDISKYLYNDLEYAVFDDYQELRTIKAIYPDSIMSGSGSAYFVLQDVSDINLNRTEFQIISGLKFINQGVMCF